MTQKPKDTSPLDYMRGLNIGLIPDGNRRWAQTHSVSTKEAYLIAAKKVAETIQYCAANGVAHLAVYSASRQNVTHRSSDVFHEIVDAFLVCYDEIVASRVNFRVLGDLTGLADEVIDKLRLVEALSPDPGGMICTVVFNYSVQWDILRATEADNAPTGNGCCYSERIVPPLDLLIRTAGVKRLSEFLPLQTAYAELVFLDVLWPDFSLDHFNTALTDFGTRTRTFGK